jgi:hypothetical protein
MQVAKACQHLRHGFGVISAAHKIQLEHTAAQN